MYFGNVAHALTTQSPEFHCHASHICEFIVRFTSTEIVLSNFTHSPTEGSIISACKPVYNEHYIRAELLVS